MKTDHLVRVPGFTVAVLAAVCSAAIIGCTPAVEEAPAPKPAAVQTRKTIGQTTQNVLELAEAMKQGGVAAAAAVNVRRETAGGDDCERAAVVIRRLLGCRCEQCGGCSTLRV